MGNASRFYCAPHADAFRDIQAMEDRTFAGGVETALAGSDAARTERAFLRVVCDCCEGCALVRRYAREVRA